MKTFELVDAPILQSKLCHVPTHRLLQIRESMKFILVRPEARVAAGLKSNRVKTWGELADWMVENDGKITLKQVVTIEDQLVEHFEKLEKAGFTAWPKEKKEAVTGFQRGYRNPWAVVPAGWFDTLALREEPDEEGDAGVEETMEERLERDAETGFDFEL